MRQRDQPLLHIAVVAKEEDLSAFCPVDMGLQVNTLVNEQGRAVSALTTAQRDLSTLNYTCVCFKNTLPAKTHMTWNWVNQAEAATEHGVISISRKTFSTWLSDRVRNIVKKNRLKVSVSTPWLTWETRMG